MRSSICVPALFSFLLIFCNGCHYFMKPAGPGGTMTSESTAVLGAYHYESPEVLAEINENSTAWLLKNGFSLYTNQTFNAVSGQDSWGMPGKLYRKSAGASQNLYVFVPEAYKPADQCQLLGVHISLKGPSKPTSKVEKKFQAIKDRFREEFPNTYDPKSGDDG